MNSQKILPACAGTGSGTVQYDACHAQEVEIILQLREELQRLLEEGSQLKKMFKKPCQKCGYVTEEHNVME